MESPECTPARSICSMMPGISTILPVKNGVCLSLHALQVLVNQNGILNALGQG